RWAVFSNSATRLSCCLVGCAERGVATGFGNGSLALVTADPTSYGIASTTGQRCCRACCSASRVITAGLVVSTTYVGTPTPAATSAWAMSQGRGPVVGASPVTSSSGVRARAASARPVSVLLNPGPYVVVATPISPHTRE